MRQVFLGAGRSQTEWKVAFSKQSANKWTTFFAGGFGGKVLVTLCKSSSLFPSLYVCVHDPGPAQLDGTTWQKSTAKKPFWTGINGRPARRPTRSWLSSRMATAGWPLNPNTAESPPGFISSGGENLVHCVTSVFQGSLSLWGDVGPDVVFSFPKKLVQRSRGRGQVEHLLAVGHTHNFSPSYTLH